MSVIGLVLLLISIPNTLEECTLRLDNVNCTDQEIAKVHFTCETKSIEDDCLCTFENPLRSELGLYKMCKSKSGLMLRKKKVRKRQIKEFRSCETIQPPRPGKASCVSSHGETVCTGECYNGYRFVDGAREHSYSCRYTEGVWKPNAVFPACEPECIRPCQNGGNCTVPNFCSCPNDYRGEICQYGVELCGLSKNLLSSSWQCFHTRIKTTCDISCHAPGTTKAKIDVQRYECSMEGWWEPPLPPCVQGTVLKKKSVELCGLSKNLLASSWQCFHTRIKTTCDISCHAPGTTKAKIDVQRYECSMEGWWEPPLPPCVQAVEYCGLSKNWLASSWQCFHTRIKTTCDISCHAPGTTEAKIDVQRYECSMEGRWEPPLPPCVQVVVHRCDDPGSIEFGHRISLKAEFTVGSSVSYKCNEGYTMSGNSTMSCQSSGQWSSEKPLCIYVQNVTDQCPKPSAPKNSIVQFSFPKNNSLPAFFNADLLLFQLSISLIANSSQTSNSDLANLPEVLFQIGARVQYKCKSRFYKLYGSQYQTCLSSRTWSGYQPACVPECGKSDSPKTPFIVNGDRSLIGQWPWIVGLAINSSKGLQLMCGGVLISETWVLTAAHCVTKRMSNSPVDAKDLLVLCGKYFRKFVRDDECVQVKQVKQIIVHDEYDFIHYDTDIALLQLEVAVELTTRVQPICLPTEVTTRANVRDGQKGMVLGWGLNENGTYSETLRETVLPVVSHDKCEKAYREGLRTVTITSNMFCAGHESGFSDTCNGDSGGPFMFSVGPANDKRWYLEGLVSWGSDSGCAEANRYSGFTKVGRFVPWINMFI